MTSFTPHGEPDLDASDFESWSTAELKSRLLALVHGRHDARQSEKLALLDSELMPLFTALARRNPTPRVEDQVVAVQGVWTPAWSTIPFHDAIPGRVFDQSYQIFRHDGFYANIAHHVPGQRGGLMEKLRSVLAGANLMIIQKYDVAEGRWLIRNIGIEVAVVRADRDLDIPAAQAWFAEVMAKKGDRYQEAADLGTPDLSALDAAAAKKLGKTFKAQPEMANIYMDADLRLVTSRREANQRPSWTIGVRRA
ncbi:hypothetical protein CH341_21850 [Rhodoplanes roseus]|uniref:Uncharacterized protein n=1 Tax=Rhodoplanes roseus TaxID=29409 RepID=A0A327KV59_9BRAD|nr:hypothetical protein CH341_21850 [Rhodoplanes roseus]